MVTMNGAYILILSQTLHVQTTCSVSTLNTRVNTHSWLVSTLHSVDGSCTLCQLVRIVSTSGRRYRFGMLFKVLTKHVGLYYIILIGNKSQLTLQANNTGSRHKSLYMSDVR